LSRPPCASHAGLLERLGSTDRAGQRAACDEALARLPAEPALREALGELLARGAPRARFAAAFVLFHAGRPGLGLLPPLLDALELGDGDLRWSAVHLLATLGRMQPEVLPVLLHESAGATSPLRRRMALYALRELAPERVETARAVQRALDDRDPEVRRAAFTSLAKLHEPEPAALDRVLAALEGEPDARLRRIAAILVPPLVRAQPERADDARSALTRAAGSTDPALARGAADALQRMGD
jgi:HEAT repeat protein